MGQHVQYGCGLSAPPEWINFDVSPTLRIQKIPLFGKLLKGRLETQFPENVRYGNIIEGLPVADNSCDGLYCSHTLEHLCLQDFYTALKNSYRILKPGGIFRCIVPDLESMARSYVRKLDEGQPSASVQFVKNTIMGVETRPRGIKAFAKSFFGNAHHLWMWDHQSLQEELKKVGFTAVRRCQFNDAEDLMFKLVENESRFQEAVALEARK